MIRIKSLLACLALVACASPEEQCINAATRDLANVNRLIVQTETNIARGYAIDTETRVSPRLTFCTGYRDNIGVSFCTADRLVERKKPVALDLDAERRKLASLQEKKRELEVVTRRAITACGA